jgi:predicted P-loop ATPase
MMQGKWIIELAELDVLSRRSVDADALKAFISRQVDSARLAYGHFVTDFPRQSVFIASKNPAADGAYLTDDTGNRRWWPVSLRPKGGTIDFAGLKAVRDQLFAEAVHIVSTPPGERLDMETDELKQMADKAASERHADHEWKERIATWLDENKPEFVTGRELFITCLGGNDVTINQKAMRAIARVMRDIGWRRIDKRKGAFTVKGYVNGAKTPDA